MDKFLKRLRQTRHFTFMLMSVWKVACMFITLLIVTYIQQGSVESLFDLFEDSFSQRNIPIKEVRQQYSVICNEVLTIHMFQLEIHVN
jgi:hypothetical protein